MQYTLESMMLSPAAMSADTPCKARPATLKPASKAMTWTPNLYGCLLKLPLDDASGDPATQKTGAKNRQRGKYLEAAAEALFTCGHQDSLTRPPGLRDDHAEALPVRYTYSPNCDEVLGRREGFDSRGHRNRDSRERVGD
jgi:hypothetical protein